MRLTELSPVRRQQVSMLYHYASLDYLKGLQQRLHALMAFIDPTLDLTKRQQRSNNGWSFLADFELSAATHIAKRAFEVYSITGANQCGRGLAEISLDWMTPDEQSDFETRFVQISLYAMNIDDTMDRSGQTTRWDDFSLALRRHEDPEALAQVPALRLRPDVTGRTGMVPVRTGVYLPIDDPHGTPQFCWTGSPAGELLECSTFNDLGLEAVAAVGRADLWVNDDSMHAFVQAHLNDPRLTCDPLFSRSTAKPKLAPSLVARNAFTNRPCDWIYVEQIRSRVIIRTKGGSS
jgi:hypothetical protein